MSVNYSVQLTTGDATGNYTLFFHTGNTYYIATLLSNSLPSTGLTLNQLLSGVNITIDDNSDQILVSGDGSCNSSIIFPIKPTLPLPTAPNLCMTFLFEGNTYSFSFTPNGTENGKTKWEYNDGTTTYKIFWNPRISNTGTGTGRWEMEFRTNLVFTTLNVSFLPDSGWYATGTASNRVLNLQVVQGSCTGTLPFNAEVIVTNTNCRGTSPCNGSITVFPFGGSGGYTYSIDGTNYQLSNIFNGLCENAFVVYVKDSNNNLILLNANVGYDNIPTTYNGSIIITNQTIITDTFNPRTKKLQTEWYLDFDNPISVGTFINFSLYSIQVQKINGPGFGTITGETKVYLNSVLQTISNTNTTTNTTPRPGCNDFTTATTITEGYLISMTNGDRVTGTSVTEMVITNPDSNASGCATTLESNIDIQNVVNPRIPTTGCQCCTVNFGKNTTSVIREQTQI